MRSMDKCGFIFVVSVSICLFVSQGCNGPKSSGGLILPAKKDATEYAGLSSELDVEIYLDATRSMKGFIEAGDASYYIRTLELFERAAVISWNKVRVKHYKFGEQLDEITGRAYIKASRPEFYSDPRYFKKTFIENVIDRAAQEKLTIIITDLFQNDSDINLLIQKLKGKYLAQNYAIGVLGIKSQFNGVVYDVGINNYSFPYASNSTEQTRFRPFYALLLGKHADIEHYYKNLGESGLNEFPIPIKVFSVFSRYLAARPASFKEGKITSINRMVELKGSLVPGLKDDFVKQFRIQSSSEKGGFSAVLKYQRLPHSIEYDANEFEGEISAWELHDAKLEENLSARQALSVKRSQFSQDVLTVEVEIDPKHLPREGIYLFRALLRPKNYQAPTWIAGWNMAPGMIEKWRQEPGSFNGATTFNLKPFLSGLQEAVIQRYQPEVGELYCYIQK